MAVERWIEGVLADDERAWMQLIQHLWQGVERRVAGSRRMGELRDSVDDRREVVTRVFARLRRNDFRALRTFPAWLARNPDKVFDDWLTILVTNVIRSYVTERIGASGLKRLVSTLAESLDGRDVLVGRPRITDALLVEELRASARSLLPHEQAAALQRWLAGDSFDEIAAALGRGDATSARNHVRAALARLRRDLR